MSQRTPRAPRLRRIALAAMLSVAAALPVSLAVPSGVAHAGPSPVFTMFVPFTEQQISDGLFSIYGSGGSPADVVTTIDITSAADSSIMYWDEWEDGYEADIANPVQATTQIWGDGNPANGAPPGVPSDLVDAGTIIFIQNQIPLPRNQGVFFYDGRDKVASTRGFAMSRAGWDSGLGTVHAGAVAATDLSKYGTQFTIPVGENTGFSAFDYTGVSVMASDANTTVEFDTNGDGSVDQTSLLDEGETAFIDGGVNAGGTIEATKPIQVHLITGERNSRYEGRWYEIFPEEIRGDEYVAAAGSTSAGERVTVFLQNPGDSSITIAVDAEGVANDANLVVAPGAVASYDLPNGSGARFSSPGNPFTAVSGTVAVTGNSSWYDWGYSLVPTSSLTPGVVVGWGAGNPDGTQNYSPVWVAPLADTTVYVDVDGDAVADQTIPDVNAYESIQIVDTSDNDMTGARVYTVDGTLLSVAWGQDPAGGECCNAYDLGSTVLPSTSLVVTKLAELVVDVNGDGNINPGDTLEYTIRAVDAGALSLTNVNVIDTLPSTLVYVPNSTARDAVPIADDTVGTPFPIDEGGVTIPVLSAGASTDITFRTRLVDPFPPFVQTVRNTVLATSDQASSNATSIVPVRIPDLYIGKSSDAPGPLLPGQTFGYDIEVSNIDVSPQTGIDVTDSLPPELTWLSTTVTRPIDDPAPGGSDVLDDTFSPAAYDNNPTEWVGSWSETDANGGGAGGGDVRIVSELGSNRLRLRGNSSAATRSFDGAAWDEATLSYDYRPDSIDDGDWVSFQITTTGGTSWIELDRVIGPLTAAGYTTLSYDLTRYLGQDVGLRWVTSPGFSPTGDSFYLDDVEVAVNDRILEVVSGGAPPALYTGGELLTGESLTVRVEVQVDAAIDPTTDSITNLATAVSLESPASVVSSATDSIARASVGDTVWLDENSDGVVDGGEPRLAGVTVELRDAGGTPIATTTTDASGNYLFADLDPGDYTVLVTGGLPAGTAIAYDADGGYDATTDVTLGFGDDNTTTDFGAAVLIDLGDRVFADVDGDGVEDGVDFGIDGLTVTLTGPSHPGGTTTTTSNGTYGFTDLLPGTYTVDVDTSPLSTSAYSTTGGDSQVVVLVSGTDDVTVDFGYVLPAAIGDTVFHDLDADGTQDPGEPPFVGVDVTITGTGLPVGGRTVTTDANGYYLFADLDAGDFTVTVAEGTGGLPVGYDSSTPGGPVRNVTVADDEIVTDVDFGFYTQATIGDFVFDDVDGNGAWDPGEPGIDGVDITITGPSFPGGTIVTTAGGGAYDVTVDPGTYTVVPDTSGFPAGTSNTFDGASPSVTVGSTDDVDTADFGYLFPASLGDLVFHDLDDSGSWDPGEPGLPGVELTLTGGTLPPGGVTTATDTDGAYLFTNIEPGIYAIAVDTATVPAGYVVTTGGDGVSGITVGSGDALLGFDFGYRGTADLGDLIFHDLNDDGDRDAGEPGLAGVEVTLTGSLVPPGTTATTDASGNYLFTDLAPGTYTVTVNTATVPAGYSATGGGDSRTVTLVSDADDLTADIGYATTATVGDFVWDDIDGDGLVDPGEPGFDGVTVTLDDGVSPPVTLDTVGGTYDFSGVAPGTYTVTVDLADLPAGVASSTGGAGQIVTVVSDQDENDVDFGFYRPASVGDRLWQDLDGDGVQDAGEPGFPSVLVTLSGPGVPPGVTDVTDANGSYDFTGLAPGAYTVTLAASDLPPGVVWTDGGGLSQTTTLESGDDEDDLDFGFFVPVTIGDTVFSDLDGDGTQDAGEPGISGVTLTLSGAGVPPGTTDDTDASGNYDFSGLAPGTYTVTLDVGDLPAGSLSTTGGFVATASVVSGGDDLTLDFGVADPVTIGDFVFDDLDGDGIQDVGEPGLAGVDVTITGPSHPGGTTVATDGTGSYEFTGLLPGTHTVAVDPVDVPPGYSASSPISIVASYASGDDVDTVDFGFTRPATVGDLVFADLDGDGVYDAGEPGLAGVTLELTGPSVPPGTTATTPALGAYSFGGLDPGTYTVTVTGVPAGYTNTVGGPFQVTTLSSGETDGTVDFGFYLGASIGDAVFEDLDGDGVQDPGEPGVGGVTVTLDDGVAPVDQDTVGGAYDFVGLTPDTYDVTIDTGDLPAGAVVTLGAGGYTFSVASGDDEDDADFGFYVPGSIGDFVWADTDADGIQDGGEPGIDGVVLRLYADDGDDVFEPGGDDALVTTETTASGGAYDFAGVAPGSYWVDVDESTLPAGAVLTTANEPDLVVVTSGLDHDTSDFGYDIVAGVTEIVYEDVDRNGSYDAGTDIPLQGVDVTFTDSEGTVQTVATDVGGAASVSAAPGTVTIDVVDSTLPAGYGLVAGTDPTDVTAVAGSTVTDTTGYEPQGDVAEVVFLDTNGNSFLDPGEELAGVSVEFTVGGATTTATTDASGTATLAGVPAGATVTIDVDDSSLPPGSVLTVGSDPTDVTAVVDTTVTDTTGYEPQGDVVEVVFLDANGNGSLDPGEELAGVSVEFTVGGATTTATTGASGTATLSGVVAGATVTIDVDDTSLPPGSVLTVGSDPANVVAVANTTVTDTTGYELQGAVSETVFDDANGNGVLDSGEELAGVSVDFTVGGSTTSALTDGTGTATLTGVSAAATVTIDVDDTTLPPGSVLTVGTDPTDVVAVANTTVSDTTGYEFVVDPSISIIKSPGTQTVILNGTATFSIVVTNDGDSTLNGVAVSDPNSPDCDRTIGTLAVTASVSYTCELNGVAADFTNVATASATALDGSPVNDSDSAVVTTVTGVISIDKTPNLQTILAGQTATFDITVTNGGTIDLFDVSVTDPASPDCDRTIGTLAAGAFTTYSCTLANVAADFTNTATATASDAEGNPSSTSDDAVVDVIAPAVSISKTPDVQSVVVDGTATFTIEVANIGDAPLTNIVVGDVLAPDCATTIASLAVSTSTSYTCTLDNVTADFTNTATVIADEPSGGTVGSSDTSDVTVLVPAIEVQKGPDYQIVGLGGSADFTIDVTNSGDTPLTDVDVTDALTPACDNTIPALALGETVSYSCTATNVAGDFTNVVVVTADDPLSNPVTAGDDAVVDLVDPGLAVRKSPDLQTLLAGETAAFTVEVENTGDIALTNVVVDDPAVPGCSGTFASLAVGAVETISCSLTNVVADFTNTVDATAVNPLGGTITVSDDAVVDVVAPGVDIQKTPDTQQVVTGGDAVFTITVTNTGDQDLVGLTVTDAATPACNSGPIDLIVGASTDYQCTAPGVTADFINIATVAGADTIGNPVSDSDDGFVDVIAPGIATSKTPDVQSVVLAGVADFTVVVTNTGDVPLTAVDLTDPNAPGCDAAIGGLVPGESVTVTCTVTGVGADFTNTATATALDPLGNPLSASDTADVNVLVPAVEIQNTPDIQAVVLGDDATFTITVTNSGATPLTDVTVVDPLAPACGAGPFDLAVGESTSYSCTLTNPTVDITTTASVSALDPLGNVWTDDDDAAVDVLVGELSIAKTPDVQSVPLGDDATFTVEVTNSGDFPLTDVTIVDALAPGCETTFATLAVGASDSITCLVTVTGDFVNTASATGLDPSLNVIDAGSDTASVTALLPDVLVEKTPDSQAIGIGQDATFTITVTNTGDVTLTTITVSDPLVASCDATVGPLTVGANAQYTCTSSDVLTAFTNTVDVTAADANGNIVTSTDSADVNVLPASITITKTPDSTAVVDGGDVVFTIEVENDGPADLVDVEVTDPTLPACDRNFAALPAGASEIYTCTQTDLDAGVADPLVNVVSVTSRDEAGGTVSTSTSASVDVLVPAVTIDKVALTPTVIEGDDAVFSITVENTGETPLADVTITDAAAPVCDALFAALAIGEVQTYTCTVTGVAADIINTADVVADDPIGGSLTDDSTATVTYVATGDLTGFVFTDEDGDGAYEPADGDTPVTNVDVVLTDGSGATTTLTTDGSGVYAATIPIGDYTIDVDDTGVPAGYPTETTGTDGQTVTVDDDVPVSAEDVGFGPPELGSVSGVVWHDIDADGVVDVGEPEIAAVTLTATCVGPDGLLGTADDSAHGPVVTTSPYLFADLVAGRCVVEVDRDSVSGERRTATYELDGVLDGATTVTVIGGGAVTGVDFGFVNLAPVAVADEASTDEAVPVVISLLDDDSDPERGELTLVSIVQPGNGTVAVDPGDTVTYTPDPGFDGVDVFSYTMCDAGGECATATVTVTVRDTNTPPTVATLDFDLPAGQPLTELPLDDLEGNGPYTVTVLSGDLPDGLTLNTDGSFTGRTTDTGTFRFTVEVCDQLRACSTQSITVTVVSDSDVPATGAASWLLARWALAVLAAGCFFLSISRRRRRVAA